MALNETEQAVVDIFQDRAKIRDQERERLRALLFDVIVELNDEFESLPRPVKAETSYAYGMAAGLILRIRSRVSQKD